jgi:hypothetical protein
MVMSVQSQREPLLKVPAAAGRVAIRKAVLTSVLALLGTILMICLGFATARATQITPLSYEGLCTQAATTAVVLLPFSLYSLVLSAKDSLKAVAVVGAIVSIMYGALLAAVL